MKPYIKSFLVAVIPTLIIIIISMVIHLMVYEFMKEEFENFFGIIVGKFVWWKYLIFWVILHTFFGLFFVSDFRRV